MPDQCYICRGQHHPRFVCQNCGGGFCPVDGRRDNRTKTSYCNDCIRTVSSAASAAAASALRHLAGAPPTVGARTERAQALGIENLAELSEQANQLISTLLASLGTLRTDLEEQLQPILDDATQPALTRLVRALETCRNVLAP